MADIIKDYCKTSTLYIIRYIADTNKSLIERFLWVVILMVSSGQMITYLLSDWRTLRKGPLRVAVEDSGLNVENIDFPAVTLCPANVIDPDKLNNLMSRVLGPSVGEEISSRFSETLKALSLVTNPNWEGGYNYILSNNVTPFPLHKDDIIPFFKSVVPSVGDMFMNCFWRGTEFPCLEFVRLQATEFGFCYSFNSFTSFRHHNDSDRNPPYLTHKGEFLGLRTNSEGRSSGVEFFTVPEDNISLNEIKYKVVVSSPRTYPPANSLRPILPRSEMVYRMEVRVEVNNADSSLEGMDSDALPCTLDSSDTLENCLLGCRHNHIWQNCRCVLYTHAVLYNNSNNTLQWFSNF